MCFLDASAVAPGFHVRNRGPPSLGTSQKDLWKFLPSLWLESGPGWTLCDDTDSSLSGYFQHAVLSESPAHHSSELFHVAAPQKGCARPTSTREHCPSSASSFCCRGGCSSFPSSWLLPGSSWKAASAWQNCCLRNWHAEETDRGEGNHLQSSCPMHFHALENAACIFPHHPGTENTADL